jgi:hypothetical protein
MLLSRLTAARRSGLAGTLLLAAAALLCLSLMCLLVIAQSLL